MTARTDISDSWRDHRPSLPDDKVEVVGGRPAIDIPPVANEAKCAKPRAVRVTTRSFLVREG